MLRGDYLWASALLAVSLGCGTGLSAGDLRDPPGADPFIEIVQRVLESERNDETTVVEVRLTNRSVHGLADVYLETVEPDGYRLRAATAIPARDQKRLQWPMGPLRSGENRTIRLQWEPLADAADLPLKCTLRASYRRATDSILEAPAKKASVKIVISAPEAATVGVPIPVKIDVMNAGSRPVRDVVLLASFADGLSHALGRELENPLGAIEPGKARSIPLELIPIKAGDLRGKVSVTLGNGAIVERDFVVCAREGLFTLTVSAPAQCACRETATLAFTIQNNGKDLNRRVRLVVRLPNGIKYAVASDGGLHVGDGCAYWDLGDLKAGQQRTVKLDALAQQAGNQKITAVLSADQHEPQSHAIVIQVHAGALEGPAPGGGP